MKQNKAALAHKRNHNTLNIWPSRSQIYIEKLILLRES